METIKTKKKNEEWEVKIQVWNETTKKWYNRIELRYWDDFIYIIKGNMLNHRLHRIVVNTQWCNERATKIIKTIAKQY